MKKSRLLTALVLTGLLAQPTMQASNEPWYFTKTGKFTLCAGVSLLAGVVTWLYYRCLRKQATDKPSKQSVTAPQRKLRNSSNVPILPIVAASLVQNSSLLTTVPAVKVAALNVATQLVVPATLLHFKQIQKIDEVDKKAAIERLAHYYGDGTIEGSQYLRDVEKACDDALKHFSFIKPTDKSLIVFDIDDTLICRYRDKMAKLGKNGCPDKFALKPVQHLWASVTQLGFKVALISSAPEVSREDRIENLEEAGYKLSEEVRQRFYLTNPSTWKEICRIARVDYDQMKAKIGGVKLEHRKKLEAEGFEIVGNVGDLETDFQGGSSGYQVKLPNLIE